MKKAQSLWILAVFTIVLTACSGGAAPQDAAPIDPAIVGESDLSVDNAQEAQESEAVDAPVNGNTQPEPRQGLEATDPASVVLAAGEPQIVEFFAFW